MTRVVAIVGPTAAGKSSVGVALASALGGQVVNADSMQLYRGMDVGTAKLPVAERDGVSHHLLDIWEVTETASVAAYQRLARKCIDGLLARGVTPIVVGGSGLYVRAALDQLEFPGTDPELRARLESELTDTGPRALHARLAARHPDVAAAILPTNGRRVVRALEAIALTGSFRATLPAQLSLYDAVHLGVDVPDLDDRIARRVDLMWELGLVDEVGRLAAAGLRDGRTASRAVGYRQVLELLDGSLKEPDARAETVRATRRLARRQRSWFRRDSRIRWIGGRPLEEVARSLGAA